MLVRPDFDPIALQLGPLSIHWYGLAYVAALVLGLWVCKRLVVRHPAPGLTPDAVEDAFLWITLGVILGGRLGYILFYALDRYLADPMAIFRVWEGGMSFHGGFLGVVVALVVFCRKHHIHIGDFADRVAPVAPIGLFLGRIANFINGELWGKPVTNVAATPWAMVFPYVDALPRHPSQLYEAALEGLILGTILLAVTWPRRAVIRRWEPTGIFITGYALSRILVENFRVPEITYNLGGLVISQGQLLSLPMLAVGLAFMVIAQRAGHARA